MNGSNEILETIQIEEYNPNYTGENRTEDFLEACYQLNKQQKYLELFFDIQFKKLVTKTLLTNDEMSLQTARDLAGFCKTIPNLIKLKAKEFKKPN